MQSFRLLFGLLFLSASQLFGQLTPIALTGFNNDAVAEAGPSSLATTSLQVDGGSSNKVMYTAAFATFAGIAGGGLPDNGTIVNGSDTYQLANYTGNNALYIYRNETRSLSLAAPASYTRLRVLGFSTEGASLLSVSLSFTDGSTTNYLISHSLPDWFNGTSNVVLQGFGRCSRTASAPWGADAFPTNPRMYYAEVVLNCADKSKTLQSIIFSNFSNFPNNAPFPNSVILGVSGINIPPPTVTSVITPCDCNGPNGSIALTVTGGTPPFSFVWNTAPSQTGPIATGLPPSPLGTPIPFYLCTITDANGCIFYHRRDVPLVSNNPIITITPSATSICPGQPVTLTANVANGSVLTRFDWRESSSPNIIGTGQSITVFPAINSSYIVFASSPSSLYSACTTVGSISITVNTIPAAPIINNTTICPGTTATLQVQGPQAGYTYNWYDAATGGTLLATGTNYTTPVLATSVTYYVDVISNTNCINNNRTPVTVTISSLPSPPSAPPVQICSGDNAILQVQNPQAGIAYNWYNTAIGGAIAGTGTSFTVNNVTAPATWYVEAVNATNCSSNTRTAVAITLLSQHPAPVVTLTNTTFTSLSFSWSAVPGAIGYMVTVNGGTSFSQPSSGPQGTTHTISGLTGNTTVTLQVIALGVQACETSNLSSPVKGTTLSSKEIFVPNVFTPNGDGRNDKLLVFGNYISSIKFSVFNQWGQLLYVSENINNGWDGTYKGYPQPIGVYAYTLRAVLQDGTIINKKGSFNLVR